MERIKRPKPELRIALVGKYIELPDAYLSVTEALRHAGWAEERAISIRWVDSERLTADDVEERLAGVAGVLVPGGFGHRGIEGKVLAARYARERGVPYLGLCLGLQCGVIEFARDVVGERDANSTEFDLFTDAPVIDLMPDQREVEDKGGSMRLGLYPARLTAGTRAAAAYGTEVIYERHRHRFEVNNQYRDALESAGMVISGQSPDGRLVEIVELRDHPWFVASQFHPEFKSRPDRPHPLFRAFVRAAMSGAGQVPGSGHRGRRHRCDPAARPGRDGRARALNHTARGAGTDPRRRRVRGGAADPVHRRDARRPPHRHRRPGHGTDVPRRLQRRQRRCQWPPSIDRVAKPRAREPGQAQARRQPAAAPGLSLAGPAAA